MAVLVEDDHVDEGDVVFSEVCLIFFQHDVSAFLSLDVFKMVCGGCARCERS